MPPDSLSKTRELPEIEALEERTRAQLLRTLLRTFVVVTGAIALIGVGVGVSGYRQAPLRPQALVSTDCFWHCSPAWGLDGQGSSAPSGTSPSRSPPSA